MTSEQRGATRVAAEPREEHRVEQSDREEEQAKEARRLDAKTTCEVVRRKAMNQLDRGNLLGGVILAAAVNHAQATSGE